ncbi:unnamed protein product [Boreogadus saida]
MDKLRQHPEQHPLRGQVVNGRYLPLSAPALDRSSSGHGHSRAFGTPGGRGQERRLGTRETEEVNGSEKDVVANERRLGKG